jgi:electron transfer flavoprotein alpha/beta subunit
VLSPFDEQAVEAALRIKDAKGGKITVISLGVNLLRDVVKKPLSLGADELILLEDPAFVGGDSWSTAYALAAAIKKVGQFDLIFCGPSGSRLGFRSGRFLYCRNTGIAAGNRGQENRGNGRQG